MKCREFVYAGEPVPEITEKKNAAFLLHYQKSILASLKQRKLLEVSQYQRLVDELEKQYSQKKCKDIPLMSVKTDNNKEEETFL